MKFIEHEKVLKIIDDNISLWKSNFKNKNINSYQYGACISALIGLKTDLEQTMPSTNLIQV